MCCGENQVGKSYLLGTGHSACKVPEDDLETDSSVGLAYSHLLMADGAGGDGETVWERKPASLMSGT